MKTTRAWTALGALVVLLAAAAPVASQTVGIPPDPLKDGPPGSITFTEGCTAIPDDGYDGTIGSMACFTIPGSSIIIDDVDVILGVDQTWIGDLTVKVQNPAGDTTVTLMSIPGGAEPADDGTFCCGDSSDISSAFPITFDDASLNDAEAAGSGIPGGDTICQDDGICDYFPNPDSGPGINLADFNGQDATGDWLVCVGDSAAGDAGQLCDAQLIFEGTPVPALPKAGMLALLLVLGLVSVYFLRRKADAV